MVKMLVVAGCWDGSDSRPKMEWKGGDVISQEWDGYETIAVQKYLTEKDIEMRQYC